MTYQFRTLSAESLPQVTTQDALQLTQLAQQLDSSGSYEKLQQLAHIEFESLHTIEEIFIKIEQGETDDIQFIEWVFCLQDKDEWDSKDSGKTHRVAKKIWKIARNDSWLKQILLLFYIQGHSKPILANALIDTISVFLDSNTKEGKVLIEVIKAIAYQDYPKITKISCDRALTPKDLLKQLNLPQPVTLVEKALDEIVEIFAGKVLTRKPDWLIKCLEQMSSEKQIKQVQLLLKRVSPEKGSNYPSLVEWLRQNYGHRTANSRWRSLSSEAQAKLLKWLNAATWGDFEKVVDVLLAKLQTRFNNAIPESSTHRQLKYQINQLERRKDFWSNYSQSFERFRFLLPQESANWLNQKLRYNVELLNSNGSEETEVCIFDFGDLYVVEFFRGAGSEMRLFSRQKNPEIGQKLFIGSKLSVEKLRCLGGEVRDHVFLWQYHTERALREKYNIRPNSGITRFKGLGRNHNLYNSYDGLSVPSIENQQARERELKRWQSTIQRLQREAKAYCENEN